MKQAKKYLIISFLMLIAVLSPISASAAGKVKISKSKVTLTAGKSTKLVVKNNKKKVKWSSSNKKVATVNSKGKVTAKKQGAAKITAKVGAKKYTCKVTVKKATKKTSAKKTTPTETEKQTETEKPNPATCKHSWKDTGNVIKGANCKKHDLAEQICKLCSTKRTYELSSYGPHQMEIVGTYAATRDTWGGFTWACSICGSGKYNVPDPNNYWLPASENEAKAYVNEMKKQYPTGTPGWGCSGWAAAVSNAIFGGSGGAPMTMSKDFRNIQVGDIISIINNGHAQICIDVHRDANGNATEFAISEANNGGMMKVDWYDATGGLWEYKVDQTTGEMYWDTNLGRCSDASAYYQSRWGGRRYTVQ